SVNFILPMDEGSIEARYVRRKDDYFIVYLSSHTGCKHSCRFCHLTASGETSFEPVDLDLYLEQALRVLSYYDSVVDVQGPAQLVHFDWMARGEAPSNPTFVEDGFTIIGCLSSMARDRGLSSKFKISTIVPKDFKTTLVDAFSGLPIDFYYSIYSMNEDFRKRWLPKAMPPTVALGMFKDWQQSEDREVMLHWPFIDGQNDSEADVHGICDAVEKVGLKTRVNVVRYNPPDDKSKESSEEVINRNFEIIRSRLSDKSKIVSRVGWDVSASCGM